jgi:hypothetical protein
VNSNRTDCRRCCVGVRSGIASQLARYCTLILKKLEYCLRRKRGGESISSRERQLCRRIRPSYESPFTFPWVKVEMDHRTGLDTVVVRIKPLSSGPKACQCTVRIVGETFPQRLRNRIVLHAEATGSERADLPGMSHRLEPVTSDC